MNFGDHPPESLVGDPSLTGAAGHYFDLRTGDLVDTHLHLRQCLDDFQEATLSQLAVEFRALHDHLDIVEDKLETVRIMSPANVLHAKLSTIETKLNDLLKNIQISPVSSKQTNETLTQTPTRQHLADNLPNFQTGPITETNTQAPLTPVAQLPSEENAKVKVLLRQFAANAMSSIEKNAFSFTNVNNHVGAVSAMKRSGIYDSPAWDNFVQLHFPHVLKSDLRDELIKIVSVKVKNTKARYKKRLLTSRSPSELPASESPSGLDS
ncbi:hypothetical protein K7432_013916 [Basidiobolus ranarum]|uniref:FRIGIDA-like protein n=1 Tax=Basidiobolus ranarum TaxID=34480 RepID=A0ABR2VR30_9FUNG